MNDQSFGADIFQKTAAEWAALAPFVRKNDLCIESDTGKMKVGNGLSWANTPYVPANIGAALLGDEGITQVTVLTEAAYAALSPKVATTLYIVTPNP